jgi:sugar lactone lactonase YvrE
MRAEQGAVRYDGGACDAAAATDAALAFADASTTILAATGKYGLTDIAIDETHVYWLESGMATPDYDARVMRVAKTGGAAEVLATMTPRAYHFTLDATHVYVAANNSPGGAVTEGVGAIVRVPKAGGAAETVLGGVSGPYAMAVDDDRVYFTTGYAYYGLVVSVPKAGGDARTLVDQVDNPWDVAVDATHVYYSEMNEGRIMRVAKTGGAPQELASGWVGTGNLGLDDATVYFVACPTGFCEAQELHAVPKAGGDARLVASRSSAAGDGDVVARSRLYWSGRAAGPDEELLGQILALPKAGGDAPLLAGGMQMPAAIAVEPDESAAYWVDVISGEVGVVRMR